MHEKDKLTATTSHGGFLFCLEAITLLIISFGTTTDEFLTCIENPSKEPQADDRRLTRQIPVRPVSALTPSRLSFRAAPAAPGGGLGLDPAVTPSALVKGAYAITNLPPFVYEHDEFGELTDPKGWDSFDTACTLYNTLTTFQYLKLLNQKEEKY